MRTEIIDKVLIAGFEKRLFKAAVFNSKNSRNPLRLNNFCYALRELIRHVLHRLAPDKEVHKCSWYKSETGKKGGITRKQRAIYAVQGGLSDEYIKNELELEPDETHSLLVKSINKLSKYTHIEESCFDLPNMQVEEIINSSIEILEEFFWLIDESRAKIIEKLWEQIDNAVIDEVLLETIQALDELASHHYIDEVYTDKVEITSISSGCVNFSAKGSIGCELQWGSNSDVKKGDGLVMPKSFDFVCSLFASVDVPNDVEAESDSLCVNTKDWHDMRYGLDEFKA